MRYYLLLLITHATAQNCPNYLPYGNQQYMTAAQLSQYNVTDPCTTLCKPPFFGEFCTNSSVTLPQGPWNTQGFYIGNQPILRTIQVDVTSISQLQFLTSGILVGIKDINLYSSNLVQISLFSKTKTILYYPKILSLTSMVIRNGLIYVARSNGITYDIATLMPTQTSVLIAATTPLPALAYFIEAVVTNGLTTLYAITSVNTVIACYPTCVTLATFPGGGLTGILSSLDGSVYVGYSTQIIRISNTSTTTFYLESTNNILCITGDQRVLIYSTSKSLTQFSLNSSNQFQARPLPQMISTTLPNYFCSIDLSEQRSQIILIQNNALTSLEATQYACPYGTTSQASLATSLASCTPCPALQDNAIFITGSVLCEWVCNPPYQRRGAWCVLPSPPPCTAHYYAGPDNACLPSMMPFAPAGSFVSTISAGANSYLPSAATSKYFLTSLSSNLIMSIPGTLYSISSSIPMPAKADNCTKLSIAFTAGTTPPYCQQTINDFYYLKGSAGILWVAFTTYITPKANCMWAATLSGNTLTVQRGWMLGANICSVEGTLQQAYAVFCGSSFIAKLTDDIVPFAGRTKRGYLDATLLESLFSNITSLIQYKGIMYVTDTQNCVIRELDAVRDKVTTVAGVQGLCRYV